MIGLYIKLITVALGAFLLLFSPLSACDLAEKINQFRPWPGLEDGKFIYESENLDIGNIQFDSVHSFDALHYRLDLNIPMQSNYFSGLMELHFRVVEHGLAQIQLHMIHLVADSAFFNSGPTSFFQGDSSIVIDLGGPQAAGETLMVGVFYHDSSSNHGFYYYSRNAYTMAEPSDARWWFPCFDEPWDKATSEISATIPENMSFGSNGFLSSIEYHPQEQSKTVTWINNHPISTYLMNLIIGDYVCWNDYYVDANNDSVPIFNMAFIEDSAMAAYDLSTIPEMLEAYSSLFCPYPFNKYGHGFVTPFAFGGMEHQSLSTINRIWITGDRTYEGGLAHELAHMWWGDYVTMSDWRHIWLNEGFATYSSALFTEYYYGHIAFLDNINSYKTAYINYDRTNRFPLYDPGYIFALPEYVKGAWVLHMLRGVIGDSLFFVGLNQYTQEFGYSNASTFDFQTVMEQVSTQDLEGFFDQWIYQQGHPYYRYSWDYAQNSGYCVVSVGITQAQTNAPIFSMPLEVLVLTSSDSIFFNIDNNLEYQGYQFEIEEPPIAVVIDPHNWVLMESEIVPSGIEEQNPFLPGQFEIAAIYPNPFNNRVVLELKVIDNNSPITLKIFDIQGRLIKTLLDSKLESGNYRIEWDSRNGEDSDLASGIYYAILSDSNLKSVKILTLLK